MADTDERTSTVLIEHQTEGLLIFDNAYHEFGLIHLEDRGWAFPAPEKDNLFRRNRLGHPPLLVGQVYHLDREPEDALRSPWLMNHVRRTAYSKARGGTLREQLKDRKSKRMVNTVALVAGSLLFCLSLLSNSALFTPDINIYQTPPPAAQTQETQTQEARE